MQDPSGGSAAEQAPHQSEQDGCQAHDETSRLFRRHLQLPALHMQSLVAQVADNVVLPHKRFACTPNLP